MLLIKAFKIFLHKSILLRKNSLNTNRIFLFLNEQIIQWTIHYAYGTLGIKTAKGISLSVLEGLFSMKYGNMKYGQWS